MKLKQLLAELRNELRRADNIDAESRGLLQDLHADIEELVDFCTDLADATGDGH